ncbi:SRPBCC family protein [Thalassococcus sp. BH17M4-6]|uniref:SRPBCC family protein n=1 Tax=Thalassococcus sp. BH17M4-6 TaxID=3413148 RepID=UPI003BBF8CBC
MTDFDPTLDLRIDRMIAARPETLWRCWTDPDLIKQWFCPAPWRVYHAEIDPRPGGIFLTAMEGPDGERHDGEAGCVLAAEPGKLFAFTDSLGPDYRPRGSGFMTGIITFAAEGNGTRYLAQVLHGTAEDRQKHFDMGFDEGWGTATDQLAALAATL